MPVEMRLGPSALILLPAALALGQPMLRGLGIGLASGGLAGLLLADSPQIDDSGHSEAALKVSHWFGSPD